MKTMFETTITHQLPTSAPRHGACVELLWKIAPDEALVVGAACVLVAQKDGQREKSKMIEWAVRKKQETCVFGGKYSKKSGFWERTCSGSAAAVWVCVRLDLQLRCAACCDENDERQVWLGPRGFGQGLSLLTTPVVGGISIECWLDSRLKVLLLRTYAVSQRRVARLFVGCLRAEDGDRSCTE
jgi:hypothetical protein